MDKQLLEDLFRAYLDARRNKRNTYNQLQFEIDYETSLIKLAKEIENKEYKVGRSVCFIIYRPVQREIFAADFRDRVVHHLVFNYINDLFDRSFIDDCYSCRKGRGTSYGIERLEKQIRACSENYTISTYALKLDISGYFMSINRALLYKKIENRILSRKNRGDKLKDRKLYLLKEIIFNEPTDGCIIKGEKSDWDGLPHDKSLFHSPEGYGLPIGNLTSQLFSNIYLNEFDHYVKRELKTKYYGRYVDDFFLLDRDKKVLLEKLRIITNYLRQQYELTVHPNKIYLQNIAKGVPFLGAFIKPYTKLIVNRTKKDINKFFYQTEHSLAKDNSGRKYLNKIEDSIASYAGYMDNFDSYRLFSTIKLKCINTFSYMQKQNL